MHLRDVPRRGLSVPRREFRADTCGEEPFIKVPGKKMAEVTVCSRERREVEIWEEVGDHVGDFKREQCYRRGGRNRVPMFSFLLCSIAVELLF